MGIDWNPIGRPKPGTEAEFVRLYEQLLAISDASRSPPKKPGFLSRLFGTSKPVSTVELDPDVIKKRWEEIQIFPYETIQAPQIGKSSSANAWAKERYAQLANPEQTEAEYLEELQGYYVVSLAPPCDGIPIYSNGSFGYVESYSFRADFLKSALDVIGSELLDRCYESCLAPELEILGQDLRSAAVEYADTHFLEEIEHVLSPDAFVEKSPEAMVHIVFSAARWCEYWSRRGHGMEADW